MCAAQVQQSELSSKDVVKTDRYRDEQPTAPNMRTPSAGWKRSVQRGYQESKSFCSKLTAVVQTMPVDSKAGYAENAVITHRSFER